MDCGVLRMGPNDAVDVMECEELPAYEVKSYEGKGICGGILLGFC